MQKLQETIATPENNYNLIRLILASSVILYHSFVLAGSSEYNDPIDAALLAHGASLGNLAVGCFFFLSGVFVSQSFHRDGSPLAFFIRRFCRLWPGLFVCLCITASFACILARGVNAFHYLCDASFYHYIFSNASFSSVWEIPGVFQGRVNSAINGSIHTLPTEVKMYALLLVFGSLVSLTRKRCIALASVFFILVIEFYYDFFSKYLGLYPTDQLLAVMFFVGAMAFTVADYIKPYLWLGAVSFGLMLIVPAPWNTIFFFMTSVWVMIFIGQAKRIWHPKADFSYGVYIYGWPSQQFITSFWSGLNPYLHAALSLLLAMGFAFLSWHLVEKPSIAFGRKLITYIAQFHVWRIRWIESL